MHEVDEALSKYHVSNMKEGETEYRSLPWRGDSVDGLVYLPVEHLQNVNFEIYSLSHKKQVAILATKTDAHAVARAAASHDGGYGDVIVRHTENKPTFLDFETWYFN